MAKFENQIKAYLDERAKQDPQFAAKYANPKKSIKECCRYIIGEAYANQEDGVGSFSDAEAFGLAVHYYDEEKVVIRSIGGAHVEIRHETKAERASMQIELTEEEKEQARKLAIERAIEEQKKKMTERKAKAKKDEQPQPEQMSLF